MPFCSRLALDVVLSRMAAAQMLQLWACQLWALLVCGLELGAVSWCRGTWELASSDT